MPSTNYEGLLYNPGPPVLVFSNPHGLAVNLVPVGGATISYKMRAWHTVLLDYKFWNSPNAPDTTGAQSGYAPGDLTGIVWLDEL